MMKEEAIKIPFDPALKVSNESIVTHSLDVTDPKCIKYRHGNIDWQLPEGIKPSVAGRLPVMIRVHKFPLASTMHIHRMSVDVFHHMAIEKFISRASETTRIPSAELRESLSDLIYQIELYLSQPEDVEVAPTKPTIRVKGEVTRHLKSKNLLSEVKELLSKAGVACPELGLRLFVLSLTRKLEEPLHGIVQCSDTLSKPLLESFVKVLPEEDARNHNLLSDKALRHPAQQNMWKNKVLVLPRLGDSKAKPDTLAEFIRAGHLDMLLVEKTMIGTYTTRNRIVEGPLAVISATALDYHRVFNCSSTMLLPVHNSQELASRIYQQTERVISGEWNVKEANEAIEKLKLIQREIRPYKVIIPHLSSLNLQDAFQGNLKEINRFIAAVKAITLLHQKPLDKLTDGEGYIKAEPQHIEMALELFQEQWMKSNDELTPRVYRTFEGIKSHLKRKHKRSAQTSTFQKKDLIKPLKGTLTSIHRHVNTLRNAGKLTIVSGNKNTGFNYQVIDWSEEGNNESNYNQLLTRVRNL